MANQVTNTRQVVIDYVRYRLQRRGLAWPNGPDPGPPSLGRVERTMRVLGEEFQERYTRVFEEMCRQLDIRPNNAEQTFVTTVGELFRDGVKWGRVVALFAFAGSLAVECVQKEMPFLVDQVVDWTERYVDTQLHSWMQQNGNWDGFVEFYEGPAERRDESPWPSLSTLCGCAIGAIGVITLGAFFSQKS